MFEKILIGFILLWILTKIIPGPTYIFMGLSIFFLGGRYIWNVLPDTLQVIILITLSLLPLYFILRHYLSYVDIYLPSISEIIPLIEHEKERKILLFMGGVFIGICFPVVAFCWLGIGFIWTIVGFITKGPSVIEIIYSNFDKPLTKSELIMREKLSK